MEENSKASASQVEANLNQKIKELRDKEESATQLNQNLTNSIETFKSQNTDMKASISALKKEKQDLANESERL